MKETPHESIAEIRLRLAQYLDGALEPHEIAEVDQLLSQFPAYQNELAHLQQARNTVREHFDRALEPDETAATQGLPSGNSLWKSISAQLKADQAQDAQSYEAEFISAYYDGEMDSDDEAVQAFEAQLPQNMGANQQLADLGAVSEIVRQFGYRLETSCTLDITNAVMAAFQAESGLMNGAESTNPDAIASNLVALPLGEKKPSAKASNVVPITQASSSHKAQDGVISANDATEAAFSVVLPEGLDVAQVEVLSAYADQALTPRETIEANRLIESDTSAKRQIGRMNWLSERIHAVSLQIQEQAPDVAPAVLTQFRNELEQAGTRSGKGRPNLLRGGWKTALPVAAAAALMILLMPAQHVNQDGLSANSRQLSALPGQAQTGALSVQPVNYQTSDNNLDDANLNGQELASLPMGEPTTRHLMDAADNAPVLVSNFHRAEASSASRADMSASELKPMLESPSPVASRPTGTMTDGTDISATRAPSSEEYLFSSLNEQAPDGDLSNVLGN